MSSPLESPAVRYGVGLSSALVLTLVAFTLVEGIVRWLLLGIAVMEILVVPQILKRVG
jgi:hypothetical protein